MRYILHVSGWLALLMLSVSMIGQYEPLSLMRTAFSLLFLFALAQLCKLSFDLGYTLAEKNFNKNKDINP